MLKFDDQFPLHRKVAALSDSAFRLHTEAIFWARRNLTDGFVPSEDLPVVSRVRDSARACAETVRRDVWHRVQDGRLVPAEAPLSGRDRETPARQEGVCAECAARHNGSLTGDGWVIHGYADWNQTRSEVLRVGEIKKKSGKAGGIASGRSRRSKVGGLSPPRKQTRSKTEADGKQRASGLVPNKRTPSVLNRTETGTRRTLPRDAPRCPKHNDQPADGCGTCRSEQIGAA